MKNFSAPILQKLFPQSFKNFFPNPSKTFLFLATHFFPALRRTYWEIHCIHNSFSNSLLKMKIGEKKKRVFFSIFCISVRFCSNGSILFLKNFSFSRQNFFFRMCGGLMGDTTAFSTPSLVYF